MTDSAQPHRVYSPTKIYLSPTARAWAREWGMTDAEMARYLIQQHMERGEPFALENDVGVAAGRDDRSGFPPDAQDRTAFDNDVGEAEAAQRLLETELPFE
jgi:hypothetical protein